MVSFTGNDHTNEKTTLFYRNFTPGMELSKLNTILVLDSLTENPFSSTVNFSGYSEYNDSLIEPQLDMNNTFPADLRFNENSLTVVIVYCVLFVIAAVGNLTVFITLFKSRHRKSRISLMITHLALADLMVTFIMIPLEVGWRITVQWRAGNLACKVFLFLRAFGLYLSSNVLVCVSLDRYFAILHPLRVNDARRRGKLMLACAWTVSLLWSVPQSIVFHVSPHPKYPTFFQCVSFGFFSSPKQEMAYNLFCVLAMYFIPLMVIIVSYTAIMCEISLKSRETNGDCYQSANANGRMRLRRSDMTNIERARSRTLRMTVTIVLVFVWCWTPYVVMTLWYMFDRDSAARVSNWLQDAFFIMAVSNSCMNPLVYGSYAMNFRKECCRCFGCVALCPPSSPARLNRNGTDIDGGAGQGGIKRRVIKCVYTLRKEQEFILWKNKKNFCFKTDNGANIVGALRPHNRLSCAAYNLNLSLELFLNSVSPEVSTLISY